MNTFYLNNLVSLSLIIHIVCFFTEPAEIAVDSVEALDSRTALLRWSLEYKGNLPIKRYHLQMKNYSTGGADWLDMDDKIPANATSYTVRYLAPAVTYGFQLAAVNEAGHSNWEAKNLTMPADGKLHATILNKELMFLDHDNRMVRKKKPNLFFCSGAVIARFYSIHRPLPIICLITERYSL